MANIKKDTIFITMKRGMKNLKINNNTITIAEKIKISDVWKNLMGVFIKKPKLLGLIQAVLRTLYES
jgi:hypothetical protein